MDVAFHPSCCQWTFAGWLLDKTKHNLHIRRIVLYWTVLICMQHLLLNEIINIRGTLNGLSNKQRLIIHANANLGFTINKKVLASACFEINTGCLELSERQSWMSEEHADVKKKKQSYSKGKDIALIKHIFFRFMND